MKDIWFNLNSTNSWGPQLISDFYFNAFIDSIQENGYSVFVVRGKFQTYNPQIFIDNLNFNQRFVAISDVQKKHNEDVKNQNYKLNIDGIDQKEMDDVIKESLKMYQIEQEKLKQQTNQSDEKNDNSGKKDNISKQTVLKVLDYDIKSESKCYIKRFR